jgi:hypothetical protein
VTRNSTYDPHDARDPRNVADVIVSAEREAEGRYTVALVLASGRTVVAHAVLLARLFDGGYTIPGDVMQRLDSLRGIAILYRDNGCANDPPYLASIVRTGPPTC